jgi:hypothetical protein
MQIKVQDFVRSRRMNRQRVTARQVLDFFAEQKHLFIPRIHLDGMRPSLSTRHTEWCRNGWQSLVDTRGGSAKATSYPLRPMLQRSTTTSGPSLPTEPSLQGRGSERCTRMRVTSMNTTTGMKTASGTPMTTKMSSIKRRSTKAVAIASVQPSKDPIREWQKRQKQRTLLDWFLALSGPSAPKRREIILETTTKFSMVTITLLGSETSSLQTCTNPLL